MKPTKLDKQIIDNLKALNKHSSKDQDRDNMYDCFWIKKHDDSISLMSTDGRRMFYQKVFESNDIYSFFNDLLIRAFGLQQINECFVGNLTEALLLKDIDSISRFLVVMKSSNRPKAENIISGIPNNTLSCEDLPILNAKFVKDCIDTMTLLGVVEFDTRNIFINTDKAPVKFAIDCNTSVVIMPIHK